MMLEIGSALSSLKAASDIAQSLLNLREAQVVQAKVGELLGEIVSARQAALSAQAAHAELVDRVRELEQAIADAKRWDAEKQKYQLQEVALGVFAYVSKASADSVEPAHSICANCCDQGQKSILQRETPAGGATRLRCHRCGTAIVVGGTPAIGPVGTERR